MNLKTQNLTIVKSCFTQHVFELHSTPCHYHRVNVGIVNNVKSCETVRARLEITIAIGFDVKKLWISLASLYLLPIYSNILVPLWFRNVISERGLSSHSSSSSLLSRDSLNGVRPSHSPEFQHQVQYLSSLAGIRIKSM